ncbi:hypothetical protein [Candidatus Methanarcanum hacksteinii]|uniref:hypothetical protein n=1 Tax=Candidatus Methanarcanum hacksteinii TaxID=2911857 RepID=UPI0037DC60A1
MKHGLSRLKKICRYTSNVMTIAGMILAISVIVTIGLGIISLITGNVSDILLSWIGHNGDEGTKIIVAATMENILILSIGSITVITIGNVMDSISKENSPFTELNADRMVLISMIYFVSSFLLLTLGFIVERRATESVFIFLGTLLVSVVMYCLALMCRYGAILQKESDETL